MFKLLPIILLIFVKCESKIEININVASNKERSNVTYSGVDEKLISDKDVYLFNITDDKLKRGFRIELGKTPNDVFLKDPTPYDNLYEIFEWKQINRDIKVKAVQIYDTISQDVVLKTSNHINNTTDTIKSKVALYETVENTLVSSWSEKGYPDQISYIINVNFEGKRFKIKQSWRKNETKCVSLNFGASRRGFIKIHPGNAATTILSAKKTTMILKIDYVTSLSGSVVANYQPVYGNYHFWAPSIASIMKRMKMNNEIITSQVMEIKCYTNPIVNVFDPTTKDKIKMITPIKTFRRKS